jgi:hypothetical protein
MGTCYDEAMFADERTFAVKPLATRLTKKDSIKNTPEQKGNLQLVRYRHLTVVSVLE